MRQMNASDCVFCKICSREVPTDFLYQDRDLVVFPDLHPKAPTHWLIVPCKHIKSVNELAEEDSALVGKMFLVAKKMAEQKGIAADGYKLIFNVGRGGGQMIDHLHLHLLAGKKFEE